MLKSKTLHKLYFLVFPSFWDKPDVFVQWIIICQGAASLPFVNDPTDPNSLWSDSFSDSLKEAVFCKNKGGDVLFFGIIIAMIGQPKAILLKTNHRISQWSRTTSSSASFFKFDFFHVSLPKRHSFFFLCDSVPGDSQRGGFAGSLLLWIHLGLHRWVGGFFLQWVEMVVKMTRKLPSKWSRRFFWAFLSPLISMSFSIPQNHLV